MLNTKERVQFTKSEGFCTNFLFYMVRIFFFCTLRSWGSRVHHLSSKGYERLDGRPFRLVRVKKCFEVALFLDM